ncbi:MAG: hypothetical protein AB7F74_20750 [Parvibaculaceae bacterium]
MAGGFEHESTGQEASEGSSKAMRAIASAVSAAGKGSDPGEPREPFSGNGEAKKTAENATVSFLTGEGRDHRGGSREDVPACDGFLPEWRAGSISIRVDLRGKLWEIETVLSQLPVVTLCGPELATVAADNYRLLRSKGATVRGTIDVIVATWCIAHNIRLIAANRDFYPMEKWLGLSRLPS